MTEKEKYLVKTMSRFVVKLFDDLNDDLKADLYPCFEQSVPFDKFISVFDGEYPEKEDFQMLFESINFVKEINRREACIEDQY